MYSITQNYSLEFKNYIKNKIFSVIENISDDFICNLFNNSSNKYLSLYSELESGIRILIIAFIKEAIAFFDQKFRDSSERKKNFYINIRCDERTITTCIGSFTICRTYYESKDRKNHFYFIDMLLGLDKYSRYDSIFKAESIDLAMSTNQNIAGKITGKFQSTIDEQLNNKFDSIHRQTISRWIKNWNLPVIKYSPIDIDGDSLYIMGDEKWIHQQIYNKTEEQFNKRNYIMSKCFVCFSGIEQKGNRRILKNKFIFITSSDTPWTDFIDAVTSIYDFEKIKNISFLSDAGPWLISGSKDLKLYPHNKIINCLCEFHVRQKVNRITKNKEYRDILNKAIDDDNKKEFKKTMTTIKSEKKGNDERIKKLTQYDDYILKHWKKIKNMAKSIYKSSMESHISHCVANYFGSRPKAFSRNNIEKYLKLQEYKLNGINIMSLYLKTYKNEEVIEYKKEELNFSIFEKSSSSNIPIIESRLTSPTYDSLYSLAHTL